MWNKTTTTAVIKGLLSLTPAKAWMGGREGGGSNSARYCYSVWLRHFVLAARHGFLSEPEIVAELGPGDSLGAGLAALLSGCKTYLAIDVVPFADKHKNLAMLDELAESFKKRSPVPDNREFPDLFPCLDDYSFPKDLLRKERLEAALTEERITLLRRNLQGERTQADSIPAVRYIAPWNSTSLVEPNSVDFIFSQAVMEHADDLQVCYDAMYSWLKPGGMISHEIDFKSHGTSASWNGHLTYSDTVWRIIRGRRPYFLNRMTCSQHLQAMQESGFSIVSTTRHKKPACISLDSVCRSIGAITEEDITTASAHIIAYKQGASLRGK